MTHGVALFDIHFPYEDRRSLSAVKQYIADSQPMIVILGGDLVDNDCISTKSRRREVEGKRILKDHTYARRELEELRKLAHPQAEFYCLQGNHDERLERYMDDHPETEGLLETETLLGLKDLGIKWIPSWRKGHVLNIGKASFIHGAYTNDHHAKQHVSNYGCNIFYGHVHDVQSYSKTMHGDDSTIIGQSCGCLCKYDAPYMKGRPNKWQQAFLNIYWRPSGDFNHQVVSIFNKQFSLEGRTYKG